MYVRMGFVIGRLEECKNYFISHLDIKEQSTTTSIIEKLPKLKMIKVLKYFCCCLRVCSTYGQQQTNYSIFHSSFWLTFFQPLK